MECAERVLALVPARGGSKGVPRKNLRLLGGKPLIAWTIEAARAARRVTRVVVSTDDPEIAGIARGCGADVPFLRPPGLATDEAGMLGVVRHALTSLLPDAFGHVALLQPTSPLRSPEDIDAAVRLCQEGGASSCVSVTELAKSPQWMYRLGPDGRLEPLLAAAPPDARRQDLAAAYALNGAVYVARCGRILDGGGFVEPGTVAHVMPPERSVDIDTEFDFVTAGALIAVGAPITTEMRHDAIG